MCKDNLERAMLEDGIIVNESDSVSRSDGLLCVCDNFTPMAWDDDGNRCAECGGVKKAKEYECVVCQIKTTTPKTLMDNDIHRYVCSSKCMADFYT